MEDDAPEPNGWDMQCPDCGSPRLRVVVNVWATLLPNGTDAEGYHEWDSKSPCACQACDWQGLAGEAHDAFVPALPLSVIKPAPPTWPPPETEYDRQARMWQNTSASEYWLAREQRDRFGNLKGAAYLQKSAADSHVTAAVYLQLANEWRAYLLSVLP